MRIVFLVPPQVHLLDITGPAHIFYEAKVFHPELDLDGIATRVEVYKYAGYFKPEEADAVFAAAQASGVTEVPNVLEGFIDIFGRSKNGPTVA